MLTEICCGVALLVLGAWGWRLRTPCRPVPPVIHVVSGDVVFDADEK